MSTSGLLHRPIYGGVFGKGRYSLASMPCIAGGLHAVRYMVIDPRAGAVISMADEKTQALVRARRRLEAVPAAPVQAALWPADEVLKAQPPRPVSRRRRGVFERSGGRCHYCSTTLQLEGPWHVEHMIPKSLLGDDLPLNLVAACAQCNLSKGARTALEFVTERRDG
jgi:5-methylcytosine-specific restriction endonuclease McrA